MNEVLQDLSAPALVTAIEENLFEFFPLVRHFPQAKVHISPDIIWSITDVPVPIFNSIAGARLAPDGADAAIEAAVARGKSRNVPLLWWTGPATRPTNLGTHLEAHGFTPSGDSAGMAADLLALNDDPPMPPGLTITQVVDAENLKRWCHPFAIGFKFPDYTERSVFEWFKGPGLNAQSPLRHYIGWLEGEPVATASVFFGAGVAGIYNVATVPDARRKGIGEAMTLAPCRDARALGYRVGILQASQMGYSVYQKIGFREYCKIGFYLWKSEIEQEKP